MEKYLSRRLAELCDRAKTCYRRDRKKFIIKLTELCCVSLLTASAVSYITYMNCADLNLAVYADGEYIGTVQDVSTAKHAASTAKADITDTVQVRANDVCKITYKFTSGTASDTVSGNELASLLYTAELSHYSRVSGIFSDGEFLTAGGDAESVKAIVKTVEDSVGAGASSLASTLTVRSVYIPTSQVSAYDDTLASIFSNLQYDTGSSDDGEILFSYSQDEDKSFSSNMIVSDSNRVPISDLTLYLVEQESVNSEIPYDTVYEDSAELTVGTETVKTEGVNGLKTTVFEKVTVFGVQTNYTELYSYTVTEPTDKVILRGTKPKTTGTTTGRFVSPIKDEYSYTDKFGGRDLNGEYDFHTGLDYDADRGTPVYASDGGKVILAGWNGTYGLCVIIRHTNGYDTMYAHLSKVTVEVGHPIEQGEQLGNVGATGKSFGDHLHFEILIGKTRYDPLKFLVD